MGKKYVNSPIQIRLNTAISLADVTTAYIYIKPPSGATTRVSATISGQYVIATYTPLVVGVYQMYPEITTPSGTWPGEDVKMRIYDVPFDYSA